jgi:hypothetical protein
MMSKGGAETSGDEEDKKDRREEESAVPQQSCRATTGEPCGSAAAGKFAAILSWRRGRAEERSVRQTVVERGGEEAERDWWILIPVRPTPAPSSTKRSGGGGVVVLEEEEEEEREREM